MMVYELIDTDGFNLVGAYRSEDDALDELRALVAVNGFEYVHTIALVLSVSPDDVRMIADGLDLAERAELTQVAVTR